MTTEEKRNWLEFVQKAASLPLGYSVIDLQRFKRIADKQFPALSPLIMACIHLAEATEKTTPLKSEELGTDNPEMEEVAKLFMDTTAFAKNSDLIRFALHSFPEMKNYRFDKMSRTAIAQRIAKHVKSLSPDVRELLLQNLYKNLASGTTRKKDERSFFSRWENVIRSL